MQSKKSPSHLAKIVKEAKFLDYRFTDLNGVCHHVTVPLEGNVTEVQKAIRSHKNFDGSSIPGWRGIEDSDMQLRPDVDSAYMDPFIDQSTIALFCDILLPNNSTYDLCPRSIGAKTIAYLKKTGVGSDALFGPEPEFFIFDSIQWNHAMNHSFYRIHSEEGAWASSEEYEGFNTGHRPAVKGGYFPLPPVDSLNDIRGEMCAKLKEAGVPVEVHHHEVATAGQCEIGTGASSLVRRGDHSQVLKYVVRNVAHQFGKTVTFMPKPLLGDNGNGMHVHQSIVRTGKNLFTGKKYGGLSQEALWYIGGILKHAQALNAITNPSTNSYKRLMPGYEAPVKLAYSARNRSASIRIPLSDDKSRRVETRFPDPMANPYLCFSALLLAGLDGIKNKIDPGDPSDYNLYAVRREDDKKHVPEVCGTLNDALNKLDSGRDFLTKTGIYTNEAIDAYLRLKWEDVEKFRQAPHPVEFDMYYSR